MKNIKLHINGTPAIIWGSSSNKLFLYVHGQGGNKEEAKFFAQLACQYSWQVLSIDLPEHGERIAEKNSFDPWHIKPELLSVIKYAKSNWSQIALCANSIGAWFSMLSFNQEQFSKCLFVSPVIDMSQLISTMMMWANITEGQLQKERYIDTSFGQTLSWDYLLYVRENPILCWKSPTQILYAEKDHIIEFKTIENFVHAFNCDVSVMKDGEHWFHTPQQLRFLKDWYEQCLRI